MRARDARSGARRSRPGPRPRRARRPGRWRRAPRRSRREIPRCRAQSPAASGVELDEGADERPVGGDDHGAADVRRRLERALDLGRRDHLARRGREHVGLPADRHDASLRRRSARGRRSRTSRPRPSRPTRRASPTAQCRARARGAARRRGGARSTGSIGGPAVPRSRSPPCVVTIPPVSTWPYCSRTGTPSAQNQRSESGATNEPPMPA